MPTRNPTLLPRLARWTGPALLLALVPKCLVCAAGYLALAGGLGGAGRELCGASSIDVPELLRNGARWCLTAGGARQALLLGALFVTVPLWGVVGRVPGRLVIFLRRLSGPRNSIR